MAALVTVRSLLLPKQRGARTVIDLRTNHLRGGRSSGQNGWLGNRSDDANTTHTRDCSVSRTFAGSFSPHLLEVCPDLASGLSSEAIGGCHRAAPTAWKPPDS